MNKVTLKKAWLIRPTLKDNFRIMEVFDEGIVACGWPGLGDLSDLRETGISEKILSKYPEGQIALEILKNIVYRLNIDDYVAVPHAEHIYFGRVTSRYIYDDTKDNVYLGCPHQRKVNWYNTGFHYTEIPLPLRTYLNSIDAPTADITMHVPTIARFLGDEIELVEIHNKFDILFEEAKKVLQQELTSNDPFVRLKAAQIIVELKVNLNH